MAPRSVAALGLSLMTALAILAPAATAHETATAGKYTIEVGWREEPAVIDNANAITIKVTDTASGAAVTDGVTLTAKITHDADAQELNLESSDDEPGLWNGPLEPTESGDYSVRVTGTVGGVAVDHTFS